MGEQRQIRKVVKTRRIFAFNVFWCLIRGRMRIWIFLLFDPGFGRIKELPAFFAPHQKDASRKGPANSHRHRLQHIIFARYLVCIELVAVDFELNHQLVDFV